MIKTEPVVVGVNVTEHFAVEFSVQVAALRVPVEFVVNDTVPDGDKPDTETEILDGELKANVPGNRLRSGHTSPYRKKYVIIVVEIDESAEIESAARRGVLAVS